MLSVLANDDSFVEQTFESGAGSVPRRFENDDLANAISVLEQKGKTVPVGLWKTVTNHVNFVGVGKVIVRFCPEYIEQASPQKGIFGVRHGNENRIVLLVERIAAVVRFDAADVFQIQFPAGSLDGIPV